MSEESEAVFTQTFTDPVTHFDGAPRIYGPFMAIVRGVNAHGERFEIETAVDDLSATDCNLRLSQPVKAGAKLFVVARLHKALVAMHVIVLKSEAQEEDASWRLSVEIIHNRFLS
jgi:hypothetical protein